MKMEIKEILSVNHQKVLLCSNLSVLTGSPSAPGGPWRQLFPPEPSLQDTESPTGPGGPGGPGVPGSPFVPWLPKPALP